MSSIADIAEIDVWDWDGKVIKKYLKQIYTAAKAQAPPRSSINDQLVNVYDTIIVPCLKLQRPMTEEKGHLAVAEVQEATSAPGHVTDFYSAMAFFITISHLDIHQHPYDNLFYKKLVIKFARLCAIAHRDLFPTSKRPSKACIMFGEVGPNALILNDIPPDYTKHLASLSTSVPEGQGKKFRAECIAIRDNDLKRWVPGYLEELHINPAAFNLEKWPRGNCAEAPLFAKYASQNSPLLVSLCVDITSVYESANLETQSGFTASACNICQKVCNCTKGPFMDLVTFTVYGRAAGNVVEAHRVAEDQPSSGQDTLPSPQFLGSLSQKPLVSASNMPAASTPPPAAYQLHGTKRSVPISTLRTSAATVESNTPQAPPPQAWAIPGSGVGRAIGGLSHASRQSTQPSVTPSTAPSPSNTINFPPFSSTRGSTQLGSGSPGSLNSAPSSPVPAQDTSDRPPRDNRRLAPTRPSSGNAWSTPPSSHPARSLSTHSSLAVPSSLTPEVREASRQTGADTRTQAAVTSAAAASQPHPRTHLQAPQQVPAPLELHPGSRRLYGAHPDGSQADRLQMGRPGERRRGDDAVSPPTRQVRGSAGRLLPGEADLEQEWLADYNQQPHANAPYPAQAGPASRPRNAAVGALSIDHERQNREASSSTAQRPTGRQLSEGQRPNTHDKSRRHDDYGGHRK